MSDKRYEAWAGRSHPQWLEYAMGGEIAKPFPEAIWPIVDKKTCGPIDGEPTNEQMMCVAFTSREQGAIRTALNEVAQLTTDLATAQRERDELERDIEQVRSERHGASGLCCGLRKRALTSAETAESRVTELEAENKKLRKLMQWFVDRCDKGEVRSNKTYYAFKRALAEGKSQ